MTSKKVPKVVPLYCSSKLFYTEDFHIISGGIVHCQRSLIQTNFLVMFLMALTCLLVVTTFPNCLSCTCAVGCCVNCTYQDRNDPECFFHSFIRNTNGEIEEKNWGKCDVIIVMGRKVQRMKPVHHLHSTEE